MVVKNKWNWIKFSEKQPTDTGIYVVISHKKEENIYLDIYPNSSSSKRVLKSNQENKIQWARWKYKEICENITDEHVIYKKEWNFYDLDNNEIKDVVFFLILPNYPIDN